MIVENRSLPRTATKGSNQPIALDVTLLTLVGSPCVYHQPTNSNPQFHRAIHRRRRPWYRSSKRMSCNRLPFEHISYPSLKGKAGFHLPAEPPRMATRLP